MKKSIIIILVTVMIFGFTGCKKKYNVDYGNSKKAFANAADSYREGQKVTLRLYPVMDEIQDVYLDDEPLYENGYSTDTINYSFVMPAHDISIRVVSRNISGINEGKGTLLYEYYDRVVGTPVARPYYSVQVFTDEEGMLLMIETVDGDSRDQKINRYLVPDALISDIEAVMEKYDMVNWNSRDDLEPIDGRCEYFRFRVNDEYLEDSTEGLPKDGFRALGEIKVTLMKYMLDQYLQKR